MLVVGRVHVQVTLGLEAHEHRDELLAGKVDAVVAHALVEKGLAHRFPGRPEVALDRRLDLLQSVISHAAMVRQQAPCAHRRMLGAMGDP